MSPAAELPRLLADRYRLERELGSGGNATVYLAQDTKHQRAVAVKVLHPDLAATLAGERFLREIAIAARLQHPHILPLLDSGEGDGSFFFVMPFVDGETLRERLRRTGPLPVAETVRILADVADALVYAHARGIVHRDIKPDNIMLSGRHALVMDFGVAKAVDAALTAERPLTVGVALGTPAYMAPEQATADPAMDHRVDLYALGVVGYELLTGRPPFQGESPQQVLTAQVLTAPEPIGARRADLPATVAQVIDRCLAKQPAERWQSAAEIVERLDPIITPSGGVTPAEVTPVGRRRVPWLALGGLIGIAGVSLAIWNFATRPRPLPAPAVTPARLTFTGSVLESSIAPNGDLLAYVADTRSGEQLVVRDLAGGNPLPLATGEMIVGIGWARDGSDLSYWIREGEGATTQSVPRLGGAPRVLAHGSGIRSPDGKRVALVSASLKDVPVVRIPEGDTATIRVPEGFRWMVGIAWSPASDRVLLAIGTVEEHRSALAIGPPGGRATIVVRDSVSLIAPVWDPSGRAVYYLRGTGGLADLMRVEIGPADQAAGPPVLLQAALSVDDNVAPRSPFFAPMSITADGRRIVYTRTERWSNIGRVTLGPGRPDSMPALLTMGTAVYGAPRLSPDGTRLAVFRTTAEGMVLGVGDADGRASQEIATVEEGLDLAWSPDGRALAFSAIQPGGGLMLGIHDLGSGTTRYVGRGQIGGRIGWSGGGLAVQKAGNRGFFRADPVTGKLGPLFETDAGTFVFFPAISPDGRRVAYYESRGLHPQTVWLTTVGETTRRILYPGLGRPLRWAPDGRSIYLALGTDRAGDPARLVRVAAEGGAPETLYRVPPGFTLEDVSPDGRVVLLNQIQRQSDVWALDLSAPARR